MPLSDAHVHFERLDAVLMPKKETQSLAPTKSPYGNSQQKRRGKNKIPRASEEAPVKGKSKLARELQVRLWVVQRGTEENVSQELMKSRFKGRLCIVCGAPISDHKTSDCPKRVAKDKKSDKKPPNNKP